KARRANTGRLQMKAWERGAEGIYALFMEADAEKPAIFEARDRRALREILPFVLRADWTFRKYVPNFGSRWLSDAEWLCRGVVTRLDDIRYLKIVLPLIVRIRRSKPYESGSLESIVRKHALFVKQLRAGKTSDERRAE